MYQQVGAILFSGHFSTELAGTGLKQARHAFVMLFGSFSAGAAAVLPDRDDKVAVCMARLFLLIQSGVPPHDLDLVLQY